MVFWPTFLNPSHIVMPTRAKKNVTEPGQLGSGYRPIYDAMESALTWPADVPKDPALCRDGVHHFLIPAFFRTISELAARGRSFTVVLRTFGHDLSNAIEALNAYAAGRHIPSVGNPVSAVALQPTELFKGEYRVGKKDSGVFVLTRAGGGIDPTETIIDERRGVRVLERGRYAKGGIAAVACRDDYHHWHDADYVPSAGKPLWLTESELSSVHHIFFDDNIHNLENDSIVAVRFRNTTNDDFTALSGAETLALHGRHLIRVPTVEPILNQRWFLEQIDACEAAVATSVLQREAAMLAKV